uniref:Uncharacterized protein n=1 Tax=Timema tahoe TaxID=61484 RepID=A0A7R9IID4_9NEOP|nr:unnamed protein product [Timema tahoe]
MHLLGASLLNPGLSSLTRSATLVCFVWPGARTTEYNKRQLALPDKNIRDCTLERLWRKNSGTLSLLISLLEREPSFVTLGTRPSEDVWGGLEEGVGVIPGSDLLTYKGSSTGKHATNPYSDGWGGGNSSLRRLTPVFTRQEGVGGRTVRHVRKRFVGTYHLSEHGTMSHLELIIPLCSIQKQTLGGSERIYHEHVVTCSFGVGRPVPTARTCRDMFVRCSKAGPNCTNLS